MSRSVGAVKVSASCDGQPISHSGVVNEASDRHKLSKNRPGKNPNLMNQPKKLIKWTKAARKSTKIDQEFTQKMADRN